ncbi:MAG: ELM1/GtrOC1 family putative glycosyltransferase [Candidatus Omnitrophota bacterium]
MKKISILDYLLLFLAKGLSFLFRAMPVSLALFIARRVGELSMFFNTKRRRIAYANLRSVFADRYSPGELKNILKRTYANLGQGLVDVLLLPKMGKKYVERYIKFENFHYPEEVLKEGNGLIFLTGHFGSWESPNAGLPYKGVACKAIAKEQKPFLINELLNSYRESQGDKIISKGPAVREAIRALRANGIVGMLVDQDAGKNGIFVELFGRKASWHRGVMEMAIKTGASIIPGFAIREKGPHLIFRLTKPIRFAAHGNKDEMIKEGFRQYVASLEAVIREYPEQWLWQHRRWKSTPVRSVLILNDGRTGHLRQSEAVANKLIELFVRKGHDPGDLSIKIVDVGFKKGLLKELLALGSNLSCGYCQGCMSCVRFCLDRRSYDDIMKHYADFVISCGSSTASVNLMLSRENNAKSIVIMKPSLVSLKKFDLLIMPWHDKPPELKNSVITDGAVNLINEGSLRHNSKKVLEITGSLKERVIGVLLGGETKDFIMDKRSIDTLLNNIIKASHEYDADILLTTSRRTPKDIEEMIKRKFKHESRCKLSVYANESNIEGAVEGILGLSSVVLVSQDSISMISESASSGKYTIVFRQKPSRNRRHEIFLKNMKKNNFIDIVSEQESFSAISNYFKNKPEQKILDDSSKIERALEGLL